MRVSVIFRFLKFVTEVRNKMSLIIFIFLIKYIINFIIKRICFYAKNNILIIIFQNKNNNKHFF